MTKTFATKWLLLWAKMLLIGAVGVGILALFIIYPPTLVTLPIGVLGFFAYLVTQDEDGDGNDY